MTFHPRVAGDYEAVLCINSSQVAGLGCGQDTPTTSIVVKAVAEDPNVELHPSHAPGSDPNLLNFGMLVGGATVGKSLELVNRGLSKVPLVLSVTSEVSGVGNILQTAPPISHCNFFSSVNPDLFVGWYFFLAEPASSHVLELQAPSPVPPPLLPTCQAPPLPAYPRPNPTPSGPRNQSTTCSQH